MEILSGNEFISHQRRPVQTALASLGFIEIPFYPFSHLLTTPAARDVAHMAS
jgi:hypothetical protein